jgi:hypothetical protein
MYKIKDNLLIAIFMGYKYYEGEPNDIDYQTLVIPGEKIRLCNTKYHCSWDWLIPVVEKIESLNLREYNYNFDALVVQIEKYECWIYMELSLDPCYTINKKSFETKFLSKIEAVYSSIVEFIEWYNQYTKK